MGTTCLMCDKNPKEPGRHYCKICISLRKGGRSTTAWRYARYEPSGIQMFGFPQGPDGKKRFRPND